VTNPKEAEGTLAERLPLQFETRRLLLRCYDANDAEWYYRMSLRNREHLREYESGNVVMTLKSEQDARETLRELAAYWRDGVCYFIGAFDKTSGDFVAQVYVGRFGTVPSEFIVGYFSDVLHEGSGYVSESVRATVDHIFSNLKAERVRIHCNEANLRSRHVAKHCGFHPFEQLQEERPGPDGGLRPCTTIVFLQQNRARNSYKSADMLGRGQSV
jgi:RimJ/RimL family protein N-acetyltransferase